MAKGTMADGQIEDRLNDAWSPPGHDPGLRGYIRSYGALDACWVCCWVGEMPKLTKQLKRRQGP